MQTMELAILDWIQNNLRCGFLDVLMPALSRTANDGEIWILLAIVLICIKGQRRYGFSVATGLLLDLLTVNIALKPFINRVRPCAVNTMVDMLVEAPTSGAFPSGHTAAAFAVVFALKTAGSPLWKPTCVLAIIMAFSRLYLYVHWPTDILGGIVVGALVGWVGAKLISFIAARLPRKNA